MRVNSMKLLTLVASGLLLSASSAFAQVKVSVHDGLVSVVAHDATVRQIIAEWARVGQANVVNADRIPGGPISIELTNVPEAEALDTLLRSAAGYLAAPRAVAVANLSRFDRVVVMPTSNAPRPTAAPATFQQQQPQFAPPAVADDDVDDDRPAPNVQMPPPRGPVFNTFPQQPQTVNPQTGQPVTGAGQAPVQQAPSPTPTAPFGGVAVPGMIVPAPQQQQPGQIAPAQPGQVRRPGGDPGA
jgi:hypothetical protein